MEIIKTKRTLKTILREKPENSAVDMKNEP
jgi:hypothetical protein